MTLRCSVFIAASLDGFIATAEGGIEWLATVEQPGEDYGYQRFFDSVDSLVVGRRTYDTVLGFGAWPYAGKRCVVLTTAQRTSQQGEEFYQGDPGKLVVRLAEEGARHIYVDGGQVIRQFLEAGLVSHLTLSVVPLLLGGGIRLFGDLRRNLRLELIASRAFASGLVQLQYGVAPLEPSAVGATPCADGQRS